jgi:glycosyltransferase involved in cell wall biosynthesis
MKKLVFISDVIPDPAGTGSEQRAFSFLVAYSKVCAVELWCHPRKDNPLMRRIHKLAEYTSEIFVFYPEMISMRHGMIQRLTSSLSSAHAVHIFKLPLIIRHPRIIWDIDELPKEFKLITKPELIQKKPKQDSIVDAWVRFSKLCKLVIASSPLETHNLLPTIRTVPNVYFAVPPRAERNITELSLFVGHLGYPPNLEAVHYYIKKILPLLPKSHRFRIVGKKPQLESQLAYLKNLKKNPQIEIHFDVASCSPYYSDASVAVVPLHNGSGTRLKILEAFAHMTPVVSTRKGCEGLDVVHGKEIIIADTEEEFATACVMLHRNLEYSKQITENGYNFLHENNSQAIAESSLYENLKATVPSLLDL